jgi:polyisoprenoid-binding protein YceI
MIKKLLIPIVAVVVVLGAAFWWFVLRDDAPEQLGRTLGDDTTETTTGPAPETLDGTWTIAPNSDSTAGLRILESFGSGLVDHEAVGRSTAVVGSIAIEGTQITEGAFTVDLTQLEFTDAPAGFSVANRANAMRNRGLETNTFPDATFELTEPIELEAQPAEGEEIEAEATGELTLHGVTNEITFTVAAVTQGNLIQVFSQEPIPVALADYDIEPPTGGPIAEIADEGSFEFRLTLTLG